MDKELPISPWPEWKIVSKIGEGSFGRVYKAQSTEKGRSFYSAIKIITIPASKGELDSVRSESGDEKSGEIETCFNALYGMMMMHLQGRQLSESTQVAMAQISKFGSLLASYFHKDKIKPLFDKEDYQ